MALKILDAASNVNGRVDSFMRVGISKSGTAVGGLYFGIKHPHDQFTMINIRRESAIELYKELKRYLIQTQREVKNEDVSGGILPSPDWM